MPGSSLIDTERRIVFSRGWGDLTDAEILLHAGTLRNDARFDPAFRQIFDFRDVEKIRVSNPTVSSVAQNNPFRRDSRRAFVVATDVAFGMVRMFEAYMDPDPGQFRIFREIGPAFEWVGLDPATTWPAREPDATFERP